MSTSERPKLAVVTPITPNNSQAHDEILRKRLPKPIVTVHKRCQLRLTELLNECFSVSDDQLFDLAKNAQVRTDQEGYFCAMRELRGKKGKIFETFFNGLDRSFLALAEADQAPIKNAGFSATRVDQLTLVATDDLEQLVAREAMVNRTFAQFKPFIEQLVQRFDAVVPVDVAVAQLPVSPGRLCELFIDACKTLDITSRAVMVLFKIFERTVLQALGPLYQGMNAHLEERGILPSSTPAADKTDAPKPAPKVNSGGLDMPFDPAFLQLDATVTPAGNPSPATQNSAAINSKRERVIAHTLAILVQQQGMAASFAPLLQQLQKPIAHIAQNDGSFFKNNNHAARRLLNTLSNSALAFGKTPQEELEADPLFTQIKTLISKLQKQAYSDPAALARLIDEFEHFLNQEQRRADLYEKRMLAAEEGKYQAQVARQQVHEAITEITNGFELHSSVRDIIDKAWQQVLFVIALKHGLTGPQWDEATQTLKDLVANTQPFVSLEGRTHALKSLEGLKLHVRMGLESVFFDPFETDNIIEQMDKTILALAQEELKTPRPEATVAVIPETVSTVDKTLSAHQQAFIGQAKNLGRGSWFDLTLPEGEEVRCRLAAIIGNFEKYIFVQRNGSKIAEKTLDEVAQALAQQTLIALDSNRIFDLALEQVITGLKKR